MSARYAWSLPADALRALGAFRRRPGIEVCEAAPLVWLRAAELDDDAWEQVRRLPGADRYAVLADGRLVRVGRRVPQGRLPAGPWHPLAERLRTMLPPCGETPLQPPTRTPLRLVRSTCEREANWLLTTVADWAAYAAVAPQVRLARWTFIADRNGRAIVRGAPLPPLPGTRFVECDGVAVPAGFAWQPALPADVVRAAFDLAPGDALLWPADAEPEQIAADDWVQATRSAARATQAIFNS